MRWTEYGAAMLMFSLQQGRQREHQHRWTEYGAAMLMFSLATLLLTYAVERLQHAIPLWNPQHWPAVEPYLAWNTAASFTTNTNWQSYVPEQTMSYLTQMILVVNEAAVFH